MTGMMKSWAAVGLAAAVVMTSFVPSQAMPMIAPTVKAQANVEAVDYRPPPPIYRGHRGYRDYRPGYRRHSNGYWFPLGAFAAGAIIGGAVMSQPRPVYRGSGLNPRHYEWCQARYRSYDAYSNTFQPYGGPRQQCFSPYY